VSGTTSRTLPLIDLTEFSNLKRASFKFSHSNSSPREPR
jgi:hypothetical protein